MQAQNMYDIVTAEQVKLKLGMVLPPICGRLPAVRNGSMHKTVPDWYVHTHGTGPNNGQHETTYCKYT